MLERDIIYITHETFTDLTNLLDKIQTNAGNAAAAPPGGFIKSPLHTRNKCVKALLADISAEALDMLERLFDETAPQLQYFVLPTAPEK